MGSCISSPKKPEKPPAEKNRIADNQPGLPGGNQEFEIRQPKRDEEPDQGERGTHSITKLITLLEAEKIEEEKIAQIGDANPLLMPNGRQKGSRLEDLLVEQEKKRQADEKQQKQIVVYGGFQEPKFWRQSFKSRQRKMQQKGREEEKKADEILKLVNFDQKPSDSNTDTFDEQEEQALAFKVIRKRSKTYVPMRLRQNLNPNNAEDVKSESEHNSELPQKERRANQEEEKEEEKQEQEIDQMDEEIKERINLTGRKHQFIRLRATIKDLIKDLTPDPNITMAEFAKNLQGFEYFIYMKNSNLLNAFTYAAIERNLKVVRALCEEYQINLSIMSWVQKIDYGNGDDINVPVQRLRYLQLSPILILKLVFDKNVFDLFCYMLDKCRNIIDARAINLNELLVMIQNSGLPNDRILMYSTKLVESDFFKRTLVENYDCAAIEVVLDPNHPSGAIEVKKSNKKDGVIFVTQHQELIDKISQAITKVRMPDKLNEVLIRIYREINTQMLHMKNLDDQMKDMLFYKPHKVSFDKALISTTFYDMNISPLESISLLSLLIRLNYLQAFEWLLQRCCCNFMKLFDSFFLVEYIDSVEVHYQGLEGIVEYAMTHNNIKIIKILYDDPHISSQFVRQHIIQRILEVIIDYILYDNKGLLENLKTEALELVLDSKTTKFAFQTLDLRLKEHFIMTYFLMRQDFKKDLKRRFKDSQESFELHENRLNTIFLDTIFFKLASQPYTLTFFIVLEKFMMSEQEELKEKMFYIEIVQVFMLAKDSLTDSDYELFLWEHHRHAVFLIKKKRKFQQAFNKLNLFDQILYQFGEKLESMCDNDILEAQLAILNQ